MEIPEVRYATTVDGVSIAYQVAGEGPLEIVYVGIPPGRRMWTSAGRGHSPRASAEDSLPAGERLGSIGEDPAFPIP